MITVQISVGSLSPTINWKDLRELEFELPDLETQRKLSDVLWAIINTAEAYKRLIAVSDELVKSQFIAEFGDPLINPMGWKTMTMKEASLLMSDGPFGSNLKSSHYSEHGVRVIRLQNICQGYFSDDDKAYIPLEHYEKIKRYTCRAGEIVIGTLGEPNLRACIIPKHISIAINKADCVHYVPNPELLDNDYVCAFLNNPATLAMVSSGIHGNTRQRISAGQLANTLIMLPPIPTQKSFGRKMRQLDKSKYVARKVTCLLHCVL